MGRQGIPEGRCLTCTKDTKKNDQECQKQRTDASSNSFPYPYPCTFPHPVSYHSSLNIEITVTSYSWFAAPRTRYEWPIFPERKMILWQGRKFLPSEVSHESAFY